jgi:hypothetical protein
MGVNSCIVDRGGGKTPRIVRPGNLVRPSGTTSGDSTATTEDGSDECPGGLAGQYADPLAAESTHGWVTCITASASCGCGHRNSSHLREHAVSGQNSKPLALALI